LNIPQSHVGVSPNIICQCYFYDRSIQFCQIGVQSLVNLMTDWNRLDGRFTRILELKAACDAVRRQTVQVPRTSSAVNSSFDVRKLDLIGPRGKVVAKGVHLYLSLGESMLVTGPSASGKSLFGAVLLGLWPIPADAEVHFSGKSLASTCLSLDILMPSPQRVYLSTGNLGDQVCYPGSYASIDPSSVNDQETKMLEALRAAGVEHIFTRDSAGWLSQQTWEEVLSGGEQQRLSLARIFFRKPLFAVLDECTSMVSADAEENLYRKVVQDFGITAVTLTQRTFMKQMYRRELQLGASNLQGWQLHEIEKDASVPRVAN